MPQLNRLLSACTSATLLLFSAGLPHSFAQTLPDYLPTDGLVAWYPLDGSIANLVDPVLDGLSFNGSYCPNRSGVPASAARLPGLIQLPINGAVLSEEFSISFWTLMRQTLGHNAVQIAAPNGPGRMNLGWTSPGGTNIYLSELECHGGYGDCGVVSSNATVSLNSWTHLTFAFSNGVISLYKNGSPVALAPSSCIVEFFCESPAMSFWFGGDVGGGAIENYDGDFDDIGIWNRALTDAEVMALYLGEAPVLGCTDPMACNYNAEANAEDGSCGLPGCNDPAASNYSGDAACANLETCVYLPDYLPSEGLVGWWPFNGNANDESGNGNHGAEYGVLPAQDRNGVSSAAFSFGGSQHIEVSNWNALQGAEAFSVSFWAKQPTNFGWLVCFGQSSNGKGFVSGTYHWGGNSIGGQLWRYDFVSSTFASVEQNTWCNIAFVYGSNVLKVYRNGQLITSQAVDYVDVQLGAGILNFGKQVDFFEYYNGTLDDIGIWNRALTDAEVMALYLGEAPVPGCTEPTACNFNPEANTDDGSCVFPGCSDPAASNYNSDAACANLESCVYLPEYLPTEGLVGWWPLDGDAQDLSGNGHHGTEVNTGDGVNRFGEASGALEFFGNSFVWGDCSGFPQLNQTVSVWFKSLDLDEGLSGRSILGYGGSSCGDSWLMLLDNNLGISSGNGEDAFNLQGHCNNDERLLSYDINEVLNQWTNWTVVNAPEGIRFFVNGVRTEMGPEFDGFGSGVYTTGRSFNFGMSASTGGSAGFWDVAASPFVGALDDIGIWNRALTDAEVMALYLGEPPMWGCTDSTACNFNPEANADDGSCVLSGCTDAAACNFDADAGCDDGSCAPADAVVGCMELGACNFNAAAVCTGTCVYPAAGLADCAAGGALCGEGMVWDVAAQTCTIDPNFVTGAIDAAVAEALDGVCGPGTVWDSTLGMCTGAGPTATCASDLNGNGAVEIQDLLILLSDYETLCPVPEPVASACGDLSAVSFDGYSYPLLAIGSQCWFKENLRSDNYRNGDPIPGGLSNAEWTSTTTGAQSPYYNDEQNLGASGRLYNGAAVLDSRGLCPVGYHVPTDTDWISLELALGMSMQEANSTGWRGTDQGMQLKSAAMDSPSWNGTNVSGFSAVAGGYRDRNSGVFNNHGDYGYWWTATSSSANAWYRILSSGNTFVYRFYSSLGDGFSVRCLQD